MAPAVVQTASGTGTGTSVSVTLGSATTAGNCLVAIAGLSGSNDAQTVSGITLGGSADHWATAFEEPTFSNPQRIQFWTDQGCAGGQTAVVVTLTGGSGTLASAVMVYELSGVETTGALDLTKGTIGSGTSPSTGTSATSAQASEIVVAAVAATGSATVTTPGSPWSGEPQVTGTGVVLGSGYQVTSATAAFTWTATLSAGSGYGCGLISLKAGAAPPPPAAPPAFARPVIVTAARSRSVVW